MKVYELTTGGHNWEKQNLVTQSDRKGRGYDVYRCKCCGIVGKSYRIGSIEIFEKDIRKMEKCKGVSRSSNIKITFCNACGPEFSGLTPGSAHPIVPPPEGQDNKRGEWVMGKTEPVLVLYGEFVYI